MAGAPGKRRGLGEIAGTWKADKALETVALLEEAEAIVLPFVVLGELRAGFAHRRRPAENEQILRRFRLKDGVQVFFAIPTNDLWLAAGPAAQSGPARPKHFDRLPKLVRV